MPPEYKLDFRDGEFYYGPIKGNLTQWRLDEKYMDVLFDMPSAVYVTDIARIMHKLLRG